MGGLLGTTPALKAYPHYSGGSLWTAMTVPPTRACSAAKPRIPGPAATPVGPTPTLPRPAPSTRPGRWACPAPTRSEPASAPRRPAADPSPAPPRTRQPPAVRPTPAWWAAKPRTPAPVATPAAPIPTPPPQAVPTTRRPRRPCPTTTLTGPGSAATRPATLDSSGCPVDEGGRRA